MRPLMNILQILLLFQLYISNDFKVHWQHSRLKNQKHNGKVESKGPFCFCCLLLLFFLTSKVSSKPRPNTITVVLVMRKKIFWIKDKKLWVLLRWHVARTHIICLLKFELVANAHFYLWCFSLTILVKIKCIDHNNIDWLLSKVEEKLLACVFPLGLCYLKQYGRKASEHGCLITVEHATNSTIDFTSFAIL